MNRRDLLKQIALLTGGAVVGGELFLAGCKTGAKADAGFTAANISLLDEIGEMEGVVKTHTSVVLAQRIDRRG